ncbi:MAG: putative toxin-antitoxin system toxin component, PIN family [Oscillospiraceae bacterium]|nr:putative toxin-antitoxin system toxin component, PIN family [Oscillospiraceae bacterium]
MRFYAVIDTNVLVSALLRWDSVPGAVMEQSLVGNIIPILSKEIMKEYEEVLRRKKFAFQEQDIVALLEGIQRRGVFLDPSTIEEGLPDPKDVVFFAVTMEARKFDATFLVTGNTKHFPLKPFVVTPREMLTILESGVELDQ